MTVQSSRSYHKNMEVTTCMIRWNPLPLVSLSSLFAPQFCASIIGITMII